MKRVARVLILWVVACAWAAESESESESETESEAWPECDVDEWCGDLRIPYPFGFKSGCYLNDDFFIYCDTTTNPPQPFLPDSNIIVTNISISGQLHVMHYIARECYTQNGDIVTDLSTQPTLTLEEGFTVSRSDNKFVAIGCYTNGLISGKINGDIYKSSCSSICDNISSIQNGTCSGHGCCQLEIPTGLKDLKLNVESSINHTYVNFNPCGYAFVIQQDKFNFSSQYILNFSLERVPIVLDWAITSNNACLQNENKTNCKDDVCGGNSRRISFLGNGSGYRCQCLEGYQGNPYLAQGCQDIDECKNESLNDCKYKWGCINKEGNYTCNCPKDYKGDGRRGGEGCTRNFNAYIQIIVGISVSLAVLLVGSTWSYLGYKKWRFIKLKEKFFKKNGGLILQQHLFQNRRQGPTDLVRIFTQQELKNATKNYAESSIVGRGGYGTVYKGVLEDGLIVAIKKSKLIDQSQTDQFINEVIVLSQINHRNVVRLIGCCLETEVPLLVYEFISNGTLFDHIHNGTKAVSFSWEVRLRIASETAGVLSYLHSSASTPIIHRDIKSTNILLDHTCTAKVSDFGASKLVPLDQTQLSTMVQGTLGYLDPEYLLTSELTEKSDVYSFGIVLLELLTGKKAVSFEGPEAERNLAMYVLCAMREDRLKEVVEKRMVTEANFEQIKETAKLAKKCLRIKREERPTMKEVAMELEGLKLMVEHQWVHNDVLNMEEMTYLLDGTSNSTSFVVSDTL